MGGWPARVSSRAVSGCGLLPERGEIAANAGERRAPAASRKEPDTFCWTLSMRRSRSAWLLSKGMVRSSRNASTCVLAEQEALQQVARRGLLDSPALSGPRSGRAAADWPRARWRAAHGSGRRSSALAPRAAAGQPCARAAATAVFISRSRRLRSLGPAPARTAPPGTSARAGGGYCTAHGDSRCGTGRRPSRRARSPPGSRAGCRSLRSLGAPRLGWMA